jgi:hypothetical protein
MNHPLRCKCGTLRGHVSEPQKAVHLMCYCKDCQAFAHFLGKGDEILDDKGGSDIVAVHPQSVHFTQGQASLTCMSLSPRGLLRWYANCCNTPIGNTSRDMRMAYAGLAHACLADGSGSLDSAFGPVRMRSATKSANGQVDSTPALAMAGTLALFAGKLLRARLDGSYRRTPFFHAGQGTPIVAPKVLGKEERARLTPPARAR